MEPVAFHPTGLPKTLTTRLLLLAAWLCFSAAALPGAPLKGKVVDEHNHPLAKVAVELFEYGDNYSLDAPTLKEKLTTDSAGNFVARSRVVNGLILARKKGRAIAWFDFERAIPAPKEIRLVLYPPGQLSGVVVDEAGQVVSNAVVCVRRALSPSPAQTKHAPGPTIAGQIAQTTFTARTGTDGRFCFRDFPTNAAADLYASAPGKTLRDTQPVSPTAKFSCQGSQDNLRLVLEPAGVIEGTIETENGEAPPPLAKLDLSERWNHGWPTWQPSVYSRPDGTFSIVSARHGPNILAASFGTNSPPDWIAESQTITVVPGQTNRGIKVVARRGAWLEITAFSQPDRRPLSGAKVYASSRAFNFTGLTDSNGLARLRVFAGENFVNAVHNRWGSPQTKILAETGQTNRVELEFEPPAKAQGTVRRPTGQPAAGLPVHLIGAEAETQTTDAQGRFTCEWFPDHGMGEPRRRPLFVVQDLTNNLVAAGELDADHPAIELTLEPAGTITCQVENEGKPHSNAQLTLVLWSGRTSCNLWWLAANTNTPGRYEFPALPLHRKYALFIQADGYSHTHLNHIALENAKTDLGTVQLHVANRSLAGVVLNTNNQPQSDVFLQISGPEHTGDCATTDQNGRFTVSNLCAGPVRISGSTENQTLNASATAGETNLTLKLCASETFTFSPSQNPPKTLTAKGVVQDPHGQPVPRAFLSFFALRGYEGVRTDAKGEFTSSWTPESFGSHDSNTYLLVRDVAGELAGCFTLTNSATNLVLQLTPALTLTGKIHDADGRPIPHAEVNAIVGIGNIATHIYEDPTRPDTNGVYHLKGLPPGLTYQLEAAALGYGVAAARIPPETAKGQVEVPALVLPKADRPIAGQVLDQNDQPVPEASLHISGKGQPYETLTTDAKGRFTGKICPGNIRIFASDSERHGSVSAEAGDTNIVIHLSPYSSTGKPVPAQPLNSKGQPRP